MNTKKRLLSPDSIEANKVAGGDCISRLVLPSSFEEVEWAIEDLLALLFEADMNGVRVYGKKITDTATWENAITLLKKAELLTGERGKVASRKLQEVVAGMSASGFSVKNSKETLPRTNDLRGDGGRPKVKIAHGSIKSVKDYDQCPDGGHILRSVGPHKVINAFKKPFRCVRRIIHFLQNVRGMARRGEAKFNQKASSASPSPPCSPSLVDYG
jgi:hypothetical protein